MHEEYIISDDVVQLAAAYEEAERDTGVSAESLALVVGRHGDHRDTGNAPGPEDVRGVVVDIKRGALAAGADPVAATIGTLAGYGERMSA